MVTVHDALEAAALGDARDLHAIALGKNRHGHRFPGLGRRVFAHREEAANHARRRLDPGLLHVARERLRRALGLLGAEAELHAAALATATTGHGPASITVTGTCVPSALKTRVMPSLRPISPFMANPNVSPAL